VERIAAHQERGRTPHETPAPERGQGLGGDRMHGGRLAQQEAHRLEEGRRSATAFALIETAAPGLADAEEHEQPYHDARYAESEKHRSPSESVSNRAGHLGAEPGADRRPQGENRQRHG